MQTLEVMTTEPVSSDLYRAAAYPGGESTSWFYNPVYSEDRHKEQVLAIAFLKGVNLSLIHILLLAAFTIASTSCLVISPMTTDILVCFMKYPL